ncbi:phage tail protein [Clostridium sp. ZBS2]|uniref:phage tail protein n=1 Tax=Clostridium sp. ZBS2 TaxID=2949976 RepID=UPI0020799471|nr:phage tail protein [Clostridium sp. ZBS2]
MSEKFYTILTNIGKSKVANFAINGEEVKFVKLKVGDGNGKYYNPIENQKDLINTVWEGKIGNIQIDKDNPNWIVLEAIIPPEVGDFTIREYGAFDEEDNLLAISKCPETYKPTISNGSTKELIIKMILSVSNTESISFEVDPNIMLAKNSKVDEIDKKVNHTISQLKDCAKNITSLSDYAKERVFKSYSCPQAYGVALNKDTTINEICSKLPNYSILFMNTDKEECITLLKQIPNRYMFLQVFKQGGARCNLRATLNDGTLYIASYHTVDNKFSGWKKISIIDSDWIPVPLLNGATSNGSDIFRYRKFNGFVIFKGGVNNVKSDNLVIGSLPYGFLPNSICGGGSVCLALLNSDKTINSVFITKDGKIMITKASSSGTCWFDGIMYPLD